MNEQKYSITLSDGTTITNLTLNGNDYISRTPIDPNIFSYNCSPIVISDDMHDEIHDNMELVQLIKVNDEYWFILRDVSIEELAKIKLQSDIEYVAMMAGVEL